MGKVQFGPLKNEYTYIMDICNMLILFFYIIKICVFVGCKQLQSLNDTTVAEL